MTTLIPTDIWLTSSDGLRLHVYDLQPSDYTRTLVLVHGYGEHAGRYFERARVFTDAGYRVLMPDVRGHGLSEGPRGHVLEYERYLDDLNRVAALVETDEAHTALMGHSHGGLIAVSRAICEHPFFGACVLSSPFLGLAIKAPAIKLTLGRVMSRIIPRLSLPSEIRPEHLSHVPEVVEAYKKDKLNHHVVNSRWFTEAMDQIDHVFRHATDIHTPMLVMHSEEDLIADPAASESFAGAAPAAYVRFEKVPGAYHEFLFEADGDKHARRIADWLDDTLAS